MSWIVNDEELNGIRLYDGGDNEVTAGTATIRYVAVRDSDSVILYLQDDEVTMSATSNTIDVTHTTDLGFVHNLKVPTAMDGLNVTFIVTDPSTGKDVYSETHYVTQFDSDDATSAAQLKGPGASVKDPSAS